MDGFDKLMHSLDARSAAMLRALSIAELRLLYAHYRLGDAYGLSKTDLIRRIAPEYTCERTGL